MKLNTKVSLLAGAIALVSAAYMPQASATVHNLNTIDAPAQKYFTNYSVAGNSSFTDWINFTLAKDGKLAAGVNSSFAASGGVTFTSFALFAGTGALSGLETPLATGTVSASASGVFNYRFGSLTGIDLTAGNYTLQVIGSNSKNGIARYAGSLNVVAVPEPEEWAMILIGAGLVSYQVRRKQKAMTQTVLN